MNAPCPAGMYGRGGRAAPGPRKADCAVGGCGEAATCVRTAVAGPNSSSEGNSPHCKQHDWPTRIPVSLEARSPSFGGDELNTWPTIRVSSGFAHDDAIAGVALRKSRYCFARSLYVQACVVPMAALVEAAWEKEAG